MCGTLCTHRPSTYRWMLSTRVLMELGRFQGSSWMLIWIKFRPRTVHSSFCLNSRAAKEHEWVRSGEGWRWLGRTVAQLPAHPVSRSQGSLPYVKVTDRTHGYSFTGRTRQNQGRHPSPGSITDILNQPPHSLPVSPQLQPTHYRHD